MGAPACAQGSYSKAGSELATMAVAKAEAAPHHCNMFEVD